MRNLTPDILLRDSHSRYSPERSQIQPGYLSIDKYTSWQFPLILVYKTYTINKIRQILQGQSVQFQFFISHLNKSNDGKCLCLGFRILQKSFSTISKVILKDSFCKNFHYGSRETVKIFVEFNHQCLHFFTA